MIRDSLPFARGSDTSEAAAESMVGHAPTVRRRVFQYIQSQGEHGSTDDEIEQALDLSHQTASARRNLLARDGAIRRIDAKRKTRSGRQAGVWVAVDGFDIDAKRPGRPRKSDQDRREVKVTAYLDRPLYADLCLAAADEGRPVSQLIRRACVRYLADKGDT